MQALAAGHEMRALVRNPPNLEADWSKIEVVVGDATTTATAVGEALKGVDAVLVARAFVPAMRDAGAGWVIVLSAFGAGETLPMASRLDRLLKGLNEPCNEAGSKPTGRYRKR